MKKGCANSKFVGFNTQAMGKIAEFNTQALGEIAGFNAQALGEVARLMKLSWTLMRVLLGFSLGLGLCV